jgi:DNA-binding IclR family transcriptional regulator
MESVSHDETHPPGRSVERVCAVLSAFTSASPHLTLAELSARTGLPKPTAHRLAGSLIATGFLRHERGGRYALGAKMSELGAVVRTERDLTELCRPVLDALAADAGETVMLAVPDWGALELTVIGSRVSPQMLSVMPLVGRHMSISAGALGKALLIGVPVDELEAALRRVTLPSWTDRSIVDPDALLDELSQWRDRGYVIAHGEFADGVSGAAVPILSENGYPRASIGITGPSFRIDERLDELGQLLCEHTANLRPSGHAVGPAA